MIVASELSTNILKHGIEGTLTIELTSFVQDVGLCLDARDRGPPIDDLPRALVDGSDASGPLDPMAYWGRRGIGAGLGAISRLSDALHYERTREGNRFVVRILRAAAERRQPGRLTRRDG